MTFSLRRATICLACLLLLTSCGEKETPPTDQMTNNKIIVKDPTKEEIWTTQEITRTGAKNIAADISTSGVIGITFFEERPNSEEDCTELGVDPPPLKQIWTLYYAQNQGGSWQEEEVLKRPFVGVPSGLDLAFSSAGEPHIATMSGEPLTGLVKYCGVNDVAVLRKTGGAWQEEIAVRDSDEAATGDPASDYGAVIGLWPALAFGPSDEAILLYKDIHGGGLQSDDRRRADLEMAIKQGGGWSALPVDMGRGAGDHNEVIIDGQGRTVIAYHIPTEAQVMAQQGIWLKRGALGEELSGADTVQIFNQSSPDGNALLWDANENRLHVLYHHPTRGYPVWLQQTDDTKFTSLSEGWEDTDIGDSRYDEGYDASLGMSSKNQLLTAYYRCTKASRNVGDCLPEDDALIFKWRDGDKWVEEVVDLGEDGALCGMDPELLVGDGDIVSLVYRCETIDQGELITTVKMATRRSLK